MTKTYIFVEKLLFEFLYVSRSPNKLRIEKENTDTHTIY